MSDVVGGVDYAKIKRKLEEELREELDIHSSFMWTKFLREGVDAHFNGVTGRVDEPPYSLKASEIWSLPEAYDSFGVDGVFKKPAGHFGASLYSKRAFSCPLLAVLTTMPD